MFDFSRNLSFLLKFVCMTYSTYFQEPKETIIIKNILTIWGLVKVTKILLEMHNNLDNNKIFPFLNENSSI